MTILRRNVDYRYLQTVMTSRLSQKVKTKPNINSQRNVARNEFRNEAPEIANLNHVTV